MILQMVMLKAEVSPPLYTYCYSIFSLLFFAHWLSPNVSRTLLLIISSTFVISPTVSLSLSLSLAVIPKTQFTCTIVNKHGANRENVI